MFRRLGLYMRDRRATIQIIAAMTITVGMPLLLGSADVLRWSRAVSTLSGAASSACDAMTLSSRSNLHTFLNPDRESLALSTFDLAVLPRYPTTSRSALVTLPDNTTGRAEGTVAASLELETLVLGLVGVRSLPINILKTCAGTPPAPVLGEYIVNSDFLSYDPENPNLPTTRWSEKFEGCTFSNFDDAQEFVRSVGWGWIHPTTFEAGDWLGSTGISLSNHGSRAGCSTRQDWTHVVLTNNSTADDGWTSIVRPIELHPGFYELRLRWDTEATDDTPCLPETHFSLRHQYTSTEIDPGPDPESLLSRDFASYTSFFNGSMIDLQGFDLPRFFQACQRGTLPDGSNFWFFEGISYEVFQEGRRLHPAAHPTGGWQNLTYVFSDRINCLQDPTLHILFNPCIGASIGVVSPAARKILRVNHYEPFLFRMRSKVSRVMPGARTFSFMTPVFMSEFSLRYLGRNREDCQRIEFSTHEGDCEFLPDASGRFLFDAAGNQMGAVSIVGVN